MQSVAKGSLSKAQTLGMSVVYIAQPCIGLPLAATPLMLSAMYAEN